MDKQKGAALIVVMSLLAISLMIGLMSMQSSQVDERLAGNYRAAAGVQMAAEMAAAQGWKDRENHDPDAEVSVEDLTGKGWQYFINDSHFSEPAIEVDCGDGVDCYYRVFESCESGDRCIIAMAAISDGGGRVLAESEQVFVEFSTGGFEDPLATHVCYGEHCSYSSGGSSELSGFDYPVPDDPGCNGNHCKSELPGDAEKRFKCYYPGVEEGHECGVDTLEPDWGAEGWASLVESLSFSNSFSDGDSVGSLGSRAAPAVVDIKSGKVSRSSGNVNTIGLFVVRDGAVFDMAGTGHHEGMIVVEPGGKLEFSGTPVFYGGMVFLEGEKDVVDLDLGGNVSVRYSSEAIRNIFRHLGSLGVGGGEPNGAIRKWF